MSANAIALDALKAAKRAINSMKVEAETAGAGGDQQMLQDACETISNEGLAASTALDKAIAVLEAEPQDGDVEQALNRMDALLDPSLNLLAVSEDSITLQGCRADMLTIRRALRMAPAAREGWQPIETAPKEWILLLGYFNESGKWRTVRGEWFCQEEIDDQWEFPENGSPGWYETCVNADEPPNCWPIEPTHWMPLPTPPKD